MAETFTNTDGKRSPLILPLTRTVPPSSGASHASTSHLPPFLACTLLHLEPLFGSAALCSWNKYAVILACSEPVCTPSSRDNSTLAVSASAHLMLTMQKSMLLLSASARDEMLCSACLCCGSLWNLRAVPSGSRAVAQCWSSFSHHV